MPDDSRQDDHDFVIYARFCLDLAVKEPDRARRLLLREMAAAWLNLTDSAPAVTATPPAARPPTDGHSPR